MHFFFSEILHHDTSGYQDSFIRAENKGFAEWQTLCAGSGTMHTIAPLHCNIFQQNKLFPPLTTILVTLHPSPEDFRVRSTIALAQRTQKIALGMYVPNIHRYVGMRIMIGLFGRVGSFGVQASDFECRSSRSSFERIQIFTGSLSY